MKTSKKINMLRWMSCFCLVSYASHIFDKYYDLKLRGVLEMNTFGKISIVFYESSVSLLMIYVLLICISLDRAEL